MAIDFKKDNLDMSLEDENDYKLKYIKSIASSFLTTEKDTLGKVVFIGNMDKINAFLNDQKINQDEERTLS